MSAIAKRDKSKRQRRGHVVNRSRNVMLQEPTGMGEGFDVEGKEERDERRVDLSWVGGEISENQ